MSRSARSILKWLIVLIFVASAVALDIYSWGGRPREVKISKPERRQFSQYKMALRMAYNLVSHTGGPPLHAQGGHAAIAYWQAACLLDAAARQLHSGYASELESLARTFLHTAVTRLPTRPTPIRQSFQRLIKFRPNWFPAPKAGNRKKGRSSVAVGSAHATKEASTGVASTHMRLRDQYRAFIKLMAASLVARASELAKLGQHAQAGVLFWEAYTLERVNFHEAPAMGIKPSARKSKLGALESAEQQFRSAKGGLEIDFDRLVKFSQSYER